MYQHWQQVNQTKTKQKLSDLTSGLDLFYENEYNGILVI